MKYYLGISKVQAAVTGKLSMTARSHPMSKVRSRSWEDPMPEGWQPRGATPRLRGGAAAKRSYPASEVRGRGRECQAVTAQELRRGATPYLRPRAADGRSNPTSKEWWLPGRRRA